MIIWDVFICCFFYEYQSVWDLLEFGRVLRLEVLLGCFDGFLALFLLFLSYYLGLFSTFLSHFLCICLTFIGEVFPDDLEYFLRIFGSNRRLDPSTGQFNLNKLRFMFSLGVQGKPIVEVGAIGAPAMGEIFDLD